MLDFSRLAIAIVTWNRPAQLQALAERLVETIPEYRMVYVIVNHPDGAKGFQPPNRCLVISSGRPPEHHGCMAKSWNLAMLWAFRDPETEWLLCTMDDLRVLPGWPAVFDKHEADLYLAPAGDTGFVFNRTALRKVGWFDERFVVIGYQEWDWQARAIRGLGLSRVSLDDQHGWSHNPIGLREYWKHVGTSEARQRDATYEPRNAAWLEQKWQMSPTRFIEMLKSGTILPTNVPEVDWYPWFPR
jgi:hypothetical protein